MLFDLHTLSVFQTASMLGAIPSALEECVKSVPDPRQLKDVLRFHTTHLDVIGESLSCVYSLYCM